MERTPIASGNSLTEAGRVPGHRGERTDETKETERRVARRETGKKAIEEPGPEHTQALEADSGGFVPLSKLPRAVEFTVDDLELLVQHSKKDGAPRFKLARAIFAMLRA